MNPEDIGQILDEIGERIGPAGQYAWELTVRQVMIESVAWAVIGALLIVAGIVCTAFFVLSLKRRWEGGAQASLCLYGLAFGLIGLAVFVINGSQLFNPEYHAMQRLLETVLP